MDKKRQRTKQMIHNDIKEVIEETERERQRRRDRER